MRVKKIFMSIEENNLCQTAILNFPTYNIGISKKSR